MAWAAVEGDRMHVIGGYAEGDVARPFHHIFDARTNAWSVAAPIPRGANHIGVAAAAGVIFAFGGFVEQNRVAVPDCYAYIVADAAGTRSGRFSAARGAPFLSWLSRKGSMRSVDGTFVRSIGTMPTVRNPTHGQASHPSQDHATTPPPLLLPE
jgi:hypothetical protein